MHKYKFKTFFLSFVLLSAVVLMVIAGFSSWIIGEKKQITPIYNFEDLFEHTTFEATYSAREIGLSDVKDPSNNNAIIKIDESKFDIVYSKDGVAIEGKPINAGTYNVSVTSKDLLDETNNHRTANVNFTIKKATPKVDINKLTLLQNSTEIDNINHFITTSSNSDGVTVSIVDTKGAIYHDESLDKAKVEGTISELDKNFVVGPNTKTCTFTPTDTTNFEEVIFNYTIDTYATVNFYNKPYNNDVPVNTQYIKKDAKVTNPYDSTDTKYQNGKFHFYGWITNENRLWAFEDGITSDISLDAKWQYTVKIELTDETVTYNRQEHTVNNVVYINDEVPTEIPSGISLSVDKYINAGNYNINANYNITSADYWLDEANSTLSALLTINKATPIVNPPTMNSIYEGESPIISGGSASGIDEEIVTGRFSLTNPDTTIEYQGTNSTSSVPVSITFTSTSQNYSNIELDVNITMKPRVYIKSSSNLYYGTIENALESATNGQSIYVIPGQIIELNSTITISKNISFYIPYENESWDITADSQIENISFIDTNETKVNTNRKTQLKFNSGANLVIENGSSLYLGGIFGTKAIYSSYTEITLSSNSHIDIHGSFYCFGYVKEENPMNGNSSGNTDKYKNEFDSNRFITVFSDGYVKTPTSISDMKSGGTLVNYVTANICPLNLFDFPCIQTYMEVYSGGSVDGAIRVKIGTGENAQYVNTQAAIIRKNTSSTALFYIESGAISIEHCTQNNSKFSNETSVTRICIDGNMSIGSLKFSVSGQNIDTSKYFLPISYKLNIFALDGASIDIGEKVKLMPGSVFQINQNATLNLNNQFVIHNANTFYDISNTGYVANKKDAIFRNNGNLIINTSGSIGGNISTNDDTKTAQCDLSKCTSQSLSVTTNEGNNNISVGYFASGDFINVDTNQVESGQLLAGSTITSYGEGMNCWIGDSSRNYTLNVLVTDVTAGAQKVCGYRVYQADDASGANQIELTPSTLDYTNSFSITSGKYIKIVENGDALFVSFTNLPEGTNYTYNSSDWYLVTGNMELTITPNEGFNLRITTESISGAGTTKYTLYVSDSKDGTFTRINQYTSTLDYNILKGNWFYVEFTGGVGTDGAVSVDRTEKKKGPDDLGVNDFAFGSSYKYQMTTDYEIYVDLKAGGCLVEGTLITMSDGSKKKVEDLKVGDMVMVFNHGTGEIDTSPIIANAHNNQQAIDIQIINLVFSNGQKTRISYEHGFFDVDLNKYVYINENNYKSMIGHNFYAIDDTNITLTDAYITYENVRLFNPVTYNYINLFADNILSIGLGDKIKGLTYIFELGENMMIDIDKMNADIEKYGLSTYDEWSQYITYDTYIALNFEYMNVAIGKQLITKETILEYIRDYL